MVIYLSFLNIRWCWSKTLAGKAASNTHPFKAFSPFMSSAPSGYGPPNIVLQRWLSCTILSCLLELYPIFWLSESRLHCQVFLGQPLLHLPSGFLLSICLVMLFGGLHYMCPIHHLLLSWSSSTTVVLPFPIGWFYWWYQASVSSESAIGSCLDSLVDCFSSSPRFSSIQVVWPSCWS